MMLESSTDSLAPFLVIKSVVGEAEPVYSDALELRREIFCGEQGVSQEEELDGKDAVAIHFVAYLDVDGFKHHQAQREISRRLAESSGVQVRYQLQPRPVAKSTTSGGGGSTGGGRYTPPMLAPVGALRMRRVSACSQLGKFNMMTAKVERLCVHKQYRRSGAGEVLLAAAEKAAEEAFHVPWVIVHAQVNATSFYKGRGYVAWSNKEFIDANIPHIVMVKNLERKDGEAAAASATTIITAMGAAGSSSSSCPPQGKEGFGTDDSIAASAAAPGVPPPLSKL